MRGSSGGASILDLHSGALSAGEQFINIHSLEEAKQIFSLQHVMIYNIVASKIQHAIAETFGIDSNNLYLTHPTFFSKLTNLEPKTAHDEYWHVHVDKVREFLFLLYNENNVNYKTYLFFTILDFLL